MPDTPTPEDPSSGQQADTQPEEMSPEQIEAAQRAAMESLQRAVSVEDPSTGTFDPRSTETVTVAGRDEGEGEVERGFDPRYRDAFDGLLFVGALTRSFKWAGHSFVVRTLTDGEVIETGMIAAKYAGTPSEVKAYQSAAVAASVVSVDGKPLPAPISTSPADSPLANRFEYVLDHWFPITIDVVYGQIRALEQEVLEVLAEMGKA